MASDLPDYRALYEREFGYVWKTLRRLGVRDRDLKDVTQEVFMTVHHLFDDVDLTRPIRPWLFAIAYRNALRYRALARHQRELLDDAPEVADPAASPDEQLSLHQARALAHAAIEHIDLPRRAVFILHEIDGESIPNVAASLQIPLNTAYSRLRLAREDFASAVRRLRARSNAKVHATPSSSVTRDAERS